MTRRLRDPEREKRLDMRHRVDSWGECPHSARKKIPLRYAKLERSYRHRVRIALLSDPEDVPVRRKEWRKWTGATAADHVRWSHERREELAENPRRSAAARARRAARRRG